MTEDRRSEPSSHESWHLSLSQNLWIGLAALAAVVPILSAPIPLTDLPGHMARYVVQIDGGRTPQLAEWYSFDWHLVPNLGVDLLIAVLGPLFGVETVTRFAVALSAGLAALGIMLTARAIHGRVTIGAVAALPLIFGFTFHYGFLNYNLALGLALCLVAVWIACEDRRSALRWGLFAALSSVLWTCHLVGWGIFCIVVGSRELLRQTAARGLLRGAVATAAIVSCLLVPLVLGHVFGPDGGERGASSGWFLFPRKLMGLLLALRDRWQAYDLAMVAVLLAVIGLLWLSRRTVIDRGMALATGILLATIVLLPHKALGSEFADIRLIPAMLIIALLAARTGPSFPGEAARVLFLAVLALTTVRLATNGYSLWDRSRTAQAELSVLDAVPRGAQLVTFHILPCGEKAWPLDWRGHLGAYALVRRGAFANDQWQIPGAQLLRIHNPAAQPFMTDASQMQTARPCGPRFQGMEWVAQAVPPAVGHMWLLWSGPPFALPGWKAVERQGASVIYERLPHARGTGPEPPPHLLPR